MQKFRLYVVILLTSWCFLFLSCINTASEIEVKKPKYIVTYSSTEYGEIDGNSSQEIEHGNNATPVTAIPDRGCTFINWSDGNTDTHRQDNNVTKNLNFIANFTRNTYNLTYLTSGMGIISGNALQEVLAGDSGTTVEAIPNEGFRFDSWSDGSIESARQETNVYDSQILTASFSEGNYNLRYSCTANGKVTGDLTQQVPYGEDGTQVVAEPFVDSYFLGWSDGLLSTTRTDTNIKKDMSIKALFGSQPIFIVFEEPSERDNQINHKNSYSEQDSLYYVFASTNLYIAYVWYLDGNIIGTENECIINISNLSYGKHSLTLVYVIDSVPFSTRTDFTKQSSNGVY